MSMSEAQADMSEEQADQPTHSVVYVAPGQPTQSVVYVAPGQYGRPPPQYGYGRCAQCGGYLTVEWPMGWIVVVIVCSILFFFLGLICLICVFSDRKWRCMNCGAVYPYTGA